MIFRWRKDNASFFTGKVSAHPRDVFYLSRDLQNLSRDLFYLSEDVQNLLRDLFYLSRDLQNLS